MLVEHARHVLSMPGAAHAEYGDGGDAIITPLACSLRGREIVVTLTPGTRTHRCYGSTSATERTTCDYGLRPDLNHIADSGGLHITAVDETGEVRALERDDHPFFVGTLYQPQLTTSASAPHPLFVGFLRTAGL